MKRSTTRISYEARKETPAQPKRTWAHRPDRAPARRLLRPSRVTDANETEIGVQTNRRKGSRDNVVRWSSRLRAAWDAAKAVRAKAWAEHRVPVSIDPEQRPLIVAAHGGPLKKSSLDTAWQRFIVQAIEQGIILEGERFGLHDLKRLGITETKGNRADKQEASGHRTASMLDVYDLSIPVVEPSGDA